MALFGVGVATIVYLLGAGLGHVLLTGTSSQPNNPNQHSHVKTMETFASRGETASILQRAKTVFRGQ